MTRNYQTTLNSKLWNVQNTLEIPIHSSSSPSPPVSPPQPSPPTTIHTLEIPIHGCRDNKKTPYAQSTQQPRQCQTHKTEVYKIAQSQTQTYKTTQSTTKPRQCSIHHKATTMLHSSEGEYHCRRRSESGEMKLQIGERRCFLPKIYDATFVNLMPGSSWNAVEEVGKGVVMSVIIRLWRRTENKGRGGKRVLRRRRKGIS